MLYEKQMITMKRTFFFISAVLLIGLSSVSCVSGKKFKSLQDTSRQYMNDRDSFKTDNITLEMANRELESKIALMEKDLAGVSEEIESVKAARDKALEDYNIISTRYNDLQNAQEELVRGSAKETQKLLAELQNAQANLQAKEDLLRQLEETLDTKKAALDELTFELEKRNARMLELEKVLDAQKRIVQDLKNKVSEALLGFENNGLTVTMKNGKVYVSLDEKLLFRSASWEIDANGRESVKKLSAELEKN